jgi:SAM-dependent methyltransferase
MSKQSSNRRPRRDLVAPFGDLEFDQLLPRMWREKSEVHFTPVDVARRAAALLVDRPGARVLDVGAAVGKFCLVGASATPDAYFVGVERRKHLVRVAETLARKLALTNVTFTCGDAVEVDWSQFDAFYLFNPFAEHLPGAVYILDDTIALDPEYFLFYIHFVRARLAEARLGTRVVAYHGFGASPPPGYVLRSDEQIGTDRLELWVKTAEARARRPTGDPLRQETSC